MWSAKHDVGAQTRAVTAFTTGDQRSKVEIEARPISTNREKGWSRPSSSESILAIKIPTSRAKCAREVGTRFIFGFASLFRIDDDFGYRYRLGRGLGL